MADNYRIRETIIHSINKSQMNFPVTKRMFTNMTINSKEGIFADEVPNNDPKIFIFGVGNNGFKNIDDLNASAPYEVENKNADLFNRIPIRLVPVEEDLDDIERSKYRGRVRKTINGEDYFAYYFKLIEFPDPVLIVEVDPTTGEETIIDTLDPNNLNPIPEATTNIGVIETGKIINTYITGDIEITGEEIFEVINILYEGDPLKAILSEIGLYSGEDKEVSGLSSGGSTIQYDESIYTQLCYHYTNLGFSFENTSSVMKKRFRISPVNSYLA
jgi:hypothetical protein